MYGVRVNENLWEPRVLMGKKAEKRENGYVMGEYANVRYMYGNLIQDNKESIAAEEVQFQRKLYEMHLEIIFAGRS